MDTADPTVSVIVLTYNSEAHIRRALRSLQRQTFTSIEVVVVDAGSTDRTRDIVAGCGLKTQWLELPKSDMGMARNHGVRNSHGRYVMFLDSDDFYLQDKVAAQIKVLETRPELDAVFGPAYIYRVGKCRRLGIKSISRRHLSLEDFLAGNCYTLGTMCLRRSAWDRGLAFGEGDLGRYGEDWRFQLNLSRRGFVFDYLEGPAVVVELRPDSHTSWDIQPRMKELALDTIEEVLGDGSVPGRRDKQAVLDAFRFKLAISLCLVGRVLDAARISRAIDSGRRQIYARGVISASRILPLAWFRGVVTTLWVLRQNRSFGWQSPSGDVCREFTELGVEW